MPVTYPNESQAYRTARNDLLQAELELRAKTEAVAALRRKLPLGGVVQDYSFQSVGGDPRALTSLFGSHSCLAVYSLMFAPGDAAPCPMCVSMLDGLNTQAAHITQRMAFGVVAANTPEALGELAAARNWTNLELYSAQGTTYQADYHAQNDSGDQLPILNVFQLNAGTPHHFWGSEVFFADVPGHPRHVDALWPLWNMFDLSREGRGEDWYPALSY